MVCATYCRTSGASGFLLKIRHGCRIETLPDGRITVSAGFDYQLTVDAAELTLKDLRMEFGKFPCAQNEEFVVRYYDRKLDNFVEVGSDEALALMWGKHLAIRTVLMSVHIVN